MNTTKTSSEKRKRASQENGKLGGVKTEEGKKIVCKNAIKHGILSNSLIDYDKNQYNELYKQKVLLLVIKLKNKTLLYHFSVLQIFDLWILYIQNIKVSKTW